MNEIVDFLKGLVGGCLFLIMLLFVVAGLALGSWTIGLAALAEEIDIVWGVIPAAVVFIAGGACYWAAVRMFRGKQGADLRCFLGGYPLLAAGIVSIVFGSALIFGELKPTIVAMSPIVLGMCWLWVAVTLFRGNSTPVDNLWHYLGGNAALVAGTLSAFQARHKYLTEPNDSLPWFNIIYTLFAFFWGMSILLSREDSSEKSTEEWLKDEKEKEAVARPRGELMGFLTSLILVAAGSIFVTVRERLTADNCMRTLAEGKTYSSVQREQLQRELEKGLTHELHGEFFMLDVDACNEVRLEGKRNIDKVSDSIG